MAQKTVGALTVASSAADSDQLPLWRGGVLQSVTAAILRLPCILKADEFGFEYPIISPANGTLRIVNNNRNIGTIVGVDMQMGAGSCTATWQIADQGAASPTNITDMASLSVTTTLLESTASAANVMQKTGSTDRMLLLVLASVVGAGPLYITFRYTRA
jgi:hypothetical protein